MKGKLESHEYSPKDFSVLLGVYNISMATEVGRVTSTVRSINVHQHWNTNVQTYDGDIAVLELTDEIKFNNYIRPICIADEDSPIVRARNGTVVGFGKTRNGQISNVAKKLEIPILDFTKCVKESSDFESFASARTFCGGSADGTGVCDGDSGGGVYVTYGNAFYLRGVTSVSAANTALQCDTKKRAVFTDVTYFYDWIKRGGLRKSDACI